MIQPLVTLLVIIPLLIGMLSVDVHGNRLSIIEMLKSDFGRIMIDTIGKAIPSNQTGVIDMEETREEYILQIDLPEFEKSLDFLNSSIAKGITFLLFQIRDFGVWLGMATAPFHYALALVIAFSFLFPITGMYIVGFFYIIISERKEIRNEFTAMRKRKKVV